MGLENRMMTNNRIKKSILYHNKRIINLYFIRFQSIRKDPVPKTLGDMPNGTAVGICLCVGDVGVQLPWLRWFPHLEIAKRVHS